MYEPEPFIGVCGVQTVSEYAGLLRRTKTGGLPDGYFLMAGVKNVTPAAMTPRLPDVVRPFMHCDFTPTEPYEVTVLRNCAQSENFVRGLQLNKLPWMEQDYSSLLYRLRQYHPDIAYVLQAHEGIMQRYTPAQIAVRLRSLPVDYILFDSSQSRNIAYNPVDMSRYIRAIKQADLEIGVVVAGGLGGSTMQKLFAPLSEEYSRLSCDAFSCLRSESTDRLSWDAVDAYLAASFASLPEAAGPYP